MNRSGVSVVITTFEQARFLAEAIESVLAQTVPVAEIVVIDDGSTDRPAEVTRRYEGVRIVAQPNRGLAAARNAGLAEASAQYVAFLDADDRFLPGALEAQLRCFASNPDAGFVYGAFVDIDETGQVIREPDLRPVGADPFAELLGGNLVGMHAAVLYRRDRLDRIGGFDARLRACEDIDVLVRMSLEYPIACHPQRVAEYRKHRENMSLSPSRMLRNALRMLAKNRRAADRRPEWRRAHRSAAKGWKRHYARVFVRAVRADAPSRPPAGRILREGIQLLGMAPRSLVAAWLE